MSWDVTLFQAPAEVSVSDLPADFEPQLFSRSDLIAKIRSIFPAANFEDPSWGVIDGEGWSIDVNIGKDEQTSGPMLHVRGGDGAVLAVMKICDVLELRGFDCSTGEFLESAADASAGFGKWAAYRDQVLSEYQKPSLLDRLRRFFR